MLSGEKKQAEGLHKAVSLDLSQHHGAQAEGLCGVVTGNALRTGLEEGHLLADMIAFLYLQFPHLLSDEPKLPIKPFCLALRAIPIK